ncbi:KilA-N domain-containing protein [Histophilus somni]|nr:KilA-N domain-containing protein [Histophilus somni]
MSNKVQFPVFNFNSSQVRVIVDPNQELWFCGADVCRILGYVNESLTLQKHCKENGVSKRYLTDKMQRQQEAIFINEPNLYRLIIKSRKPEAEKFEAWVFEEVLPQIRKTGKYALQNSAENQPKQLTLPEPEKKIIDNKNKPEYTGVLSKNTKRLPHPSDLAVFLCQFNGGTIAGKYNTLMGIPSSGFLCIPESESRHPQTNVANLSKNTKELAMANIITAHYNGTEVFFQDDAYLNATAIAKYFNKRPNDWLALPTTQEYIETLCKKTETRKSGNATKVGKSHFVKTVKGGKDLSQQGTWLHRRLAVAFARWLNVEFAIWCDEQIEKILISKNQPQQLALPEPKPRGILLDEEAFYVVAKAIAKLNESTFEWEKMMDLFSELESHRNYKTAFNLGVASYNLAQSSEKIIMKNLVQMRNKVWKK